MKKISNTFYNTLVYSLVGTTTLVMAPGAQASQCSDPRAYQQALACAQANGTCQAFAQCMSDADRANNPQTNYASCINPNCTTPPGGGSPTVSTTIPGLTNITIGGNGGKNGNPVTDIPPDTDGTGITGGTSGTGGTGGTNLGPAYLCVESRAAITSLPIMGVSELGAELGNLEGLVQKDATAECSKLMSQNLGRPGTQTYYNPAYPNLISGHTFAYALQWVNCAQGGSIYNAYAGKAQYSVGPTSTRQNHNTLFDYNMPVGDYGYAGAYAVCKYPY